MPKSKFQKQQEAIERKRTMISVYRQNWIDACLKAQNRTNDVSINDELDNQVRKTRKEFEQACEEAQIDTHGNPLPGSILK